MNLSPLSRAGLRAGTCAVALAITMPLSANDKTAAAAQPQPEPAGQPARDRPAQSRRCHDRDHEDPGLKRRLVQHILQLLRQGHRIKGFGDYTYCAKLEITFYFLWLHLSGHKYDRCGRQLWKRTQTFKCFRAIHPRHHYIA